MLSVNECSQFISSLNKATHTNEGKVYLVEENGEEGSLQHGYALSSSKQKSFRTEQIADVSQKCIEALMQDETLAYKNKTALLSSLKEGLCLYQGRVKTSVENRHWYTKVLYFFLALFGQGVTLPESFRNAVKKNEEASLTLSKKGAILPNDPLFPFLKDIAEAREDFEEAGVKKTKVTYKSLVVDLFEYDATGKPKDTFVRKYPDGQAYTVKILTEKDPLSPYLLEPAKEREDFEVEGIKKVRVAYKNGIVDEFMLSSSGEVSKYRIRFYTFGMSKEGLFSHDNKVLKSGVVKQKMHDEYFEDFYNPELLSSSLLLSPSFASIHLNGKQETLPLTYRENGSWVRYEGSNHELLLNLARNSSAAFCETISDYRFNINKEDFLHFLFAPHHTIKGKTPIFTLSSSCFQAVLEMAKREKIPLNLAEKDPTTKKDLFETYVGNESSALRMIECDPSILIKEGRLRADILSEAFRLGHTKLALAIIDTVEKEKTALSIEDGYLIRAYRDDDTFPNEEFNSLSEVAKHKMYDVAKLCHSEKVLMKLHQLGVHEIG